MKTVLQALAGLALAVALLWWVFHDTSRAGLREAVERAFWPGLALAAVVNVGHNVFRVWRWRWLLDPVAPRVPFRPMFVAVILGYLTTWILPGRIGEVVRPGLLSARTTVPLGPSMGSVVADRLLDGLAIMALFAAGSLGARFAEGSAASIEKIRSTAFAFLAVIAVGVVVLVAIAASRTTFERWLARRAAPVRWLGHAILGFSSGMEALRSPRRLIPIIVHSLLAWLTIALGTWIGIRASGADVGFDAVLVMLPLLALGVAIPTPGGVGGYHAAMQFGLTRLFGVDPTIAAGAGLLVHIAIVVPILLLGPVLLRVEGVSWSDLVAAARQIKSLGAAPVSSGATR
ncbi:MAG TPA: lysylphosphatidylglycerol synthase transmembrane domain-containing protein [Candidatus Polarisedimenticolaceae bacterium]|nr:lysylphosphatidylglycerol synthase transmembrane domain-containing protein [Candidatus Polarisedimenticolaceae bacterium]